MIPEHARVVTLRGEVFRGNGLIIAGKPPSAPTLSRPREIRELVGAVETTARLLRLEGVRLTAEQLQAATAEHAKRESELEGLREFLMEQQAIEHRAELEVERQRRLVEWHRGRRDELLRERADAEKEKQSLSEVIVEHERIWEAARSTLQLISDELSHLSLDEAQELSAYWSTRSAVTQQAVEAARLRKAEHELIQQRVARQEQDLQTKMDEDWPNARLDAGARGWWRGSMACSSKSYPAEQIGPADRAGDLGEPGDWPDGSSRLRADEC
jgi:chromosome segregation ATPase